jgi:hypothetical protein
MFLSFQAICFRETAHEGRKKEESEAKDKKNWVKEQVSPCGGTLYLVPTSYAINTSANKVRRY